MRPELLRAGRFGLVGVTSAAAYFFVSSMFVAIDFAGPVGATTVGQAASALISYFGHLHFSFAVEPDHHRFFWRFLTAALAMFLLNVGLTWLLAHRFQLPYSLVFAIVTVVLATMGYLAGRLWIFVPRRATPPQDAPAGPSE